MEFDIFVNADGTLEYVYSDELSVLFKGEATETKRASHVEPAPGGWSADLSPVGGPVLGPFETRAEALASEVEWLKAQMAEGSLTDGR